ncbi:MAG: polysaccharide pyruvyl transferase family protein [Oscillospiraceae bacterium]|nr:polysaccharide pyruvyl transferase family protein [Oscillospiraceae bacterium]
MNILLYGNGSSGNHGCEAITRGTVAVLGSDHKYTIQSVQPADDIRYGLDNLAEIRTATCTAKHDLRFVAAYLKMKILGAYTDMDGLNYVPGIRRAAQAHKLALSVGGDNYCYPGTEIYGWLNREYRKHGVKTVLWGCSIEPEIVAKPQVAKDLASYDMIVTRESISYEAIRKVQKNTVLAPDPAFFMEPQECPLDDRLKTGNVIGINISPMIISAEKAAGMAYENYRSLIAHILQTTDACVALIPHVVWASNDDRTVLRRLYEDFDRDPRLILVEDHSAPELKYIISHCRMFIGARTHATIAAYSSCVPTLVVGYSVKARGIARDLFGTEGNYVLPVQKLTTPKQLTDAFIWLKEHEETIRAHLMAHMPEYSKNTVTLEKIKEIVML